MFITSKWKLLIIIIFAIIKLSLQNNSDEEGLPDEEGLHAGGIVHERALYLDDDGGDDEEEVDDDDERLAVYTTAADEEGLHDDSGDDEEEEDDDDERSAVDPNNMNIPKNRYNLVADHGPEKKPNHGHMAKQLKQKLNSFVDDMLEGDYYDDTHSEDDEDDDDEDYASEETLDFNENFADTLGLDKEFTVDYKVCENIEDDKLRTQIHILPRFFENFDVYRNRIHDKVSLNKEEYDSITSRFPKLFETYNSYDERLKKQGLEPFTINMVKCYKSLYPVIGENLEAYRFKRLPLYKLEPLSAKEIDIFYSDFPIPGEIIQSYLRRCPRYTDEDYHGFYLMFPGYYELYPSYSLRLNSMDLDPIKISDFKNFKQNYPKLTYTYEEYQQIRRKMLLKPMDIEDFKIYKKMHPQPGENDYKAYLRRLKTIIPLQNHELNNTEFINELKYMGYPVLHNQGFKLYNTKFPRALENYKRHCIRLEKIDVKIIRKPDFEALKKATVFREETFQEYSSRMESYFLDLTLYGEEEFESFKFYYPHVGENFMQYWDRLKKKHPQLPGELQSEYSERMIELGILTINPNVFEEFVKSYPLPYESFTQFTNRIFYFNYIAVKSFTRDSFNKLKRILPSICESHQTYIHKTRDLGLSELSKAQYNKFIFGLPQVGETKPMFIKRLKLIGPSEKKIEKVKHLYSLNAAFIDLFETTPAEIEESFFAESTQVFESFNEICPSFFPNYVEYINNTKTTEGTDPLNESEFICVKNHYPKLDQDLNTHNFFLKSKNLQPVSPEFFRELKLIYPQLDHFTYAKYKKSVIGLTLPKLTQDEFFSYKSKLPNIFDFNYNQYLIRIDSLTFNKNNEDQNTETKVPSPYVGSGYWNFIRHEVQPEFRRAVKKQPKITMFADPYHFNNHHFESIKRALYPKRSISFSEYKAEMKILGLKPLSENLFKYFKELYPAIGEEYTAYHIRVNTQVNKNLRNNRDERNDRISHLKKHVMTQNEYTFLKQRMPSQFEQTYELYVQRMNNSNPGFEPLSEEDYVDIMKTYPQYFESYIDYMLRLQDLYLEPMSVEIFNDFKLVLPRIILESYDLYINRIKEHKHGEIVSKKLNTLRQMSIDEFTLYKSRIPLQYESQAKYENRMSQMNKEPYQVTEFDSLKIIYPKLADTYNDYQNVMATYDLFKLSSKEFSSFKMFYPGQCDIKYEHYIEHLQAYELKIDGETDDQYVNRLKGALFADLPILSSDEFNEYLAVMPRGNESYTDFSMRTYKILDRENRPLEVLHRPQFLYLKKLLPFRYENFEDYKNRFELYSIRPMNLEQFKQFKALFPILGEQLDEYWSRITSTYPEIPHETNEDYAIRIRELGAVTKKNFETFMESYPFPYEKFKGFQARRTEYAIDNFETPAQLKDWFHKLEFLLPRICEDVQKYTLRTQNLGYPPLNEEQFRRYMYALPQPGESEESFTERLLNRAAKLYYTEIFKNFTQMVPKFIHTDYTIYSKKIKNKGLEPLNLDEFNCFHKFYPKLNEDNIMYRKKLKTLNLFEVTPRVLQLYKKVYPRLHHIDYPMYQRDATKSGLPMLSKKQFLDYKQKIPRLFDSYHIYRKRHTDTNLNYFTNEEFNEIYVTHYARITEKIFSKDGYTARMNYLALDPMPEIYLIYFRGIFPFLNDTFNTYTQRIHEKVYPILKNRNEQDTLIDYLSIHILTEEQFGHYQKNFPRLIEVYPEYLKRRQELEKLFPKMKDEFGEFTETMFYDLRDSFYPILGEKFQDFRTKTLYYESAVNVYKLFVQIYPLIGENRESYNTRTADLSASSIPDLEYLDSIQLSDDEFQIFKKTFPHPLDIYEDYVAKMQKNSLIPVNIDRFMWYNKVFPDLDKDSNYYIHACSEIFINFPDTIKLKSIFDYIKNYYPVFHQSYIEYKVRFEQFLSKSDADLLNNEYADLQNTLEITIMSKDKFDNYKKTLPLPKEDEKKYTIRIKKLGLTPYTLGVISSILEIYPTRNDSLSEYNKKMETIGMPQMTNNKHYQIYQSLLSSMDDDLSAEIDFEETFETLVFR